MLTILAAVLCLVLVGIQLPRYIGPEKTTVPGVAVRVVTANLGMGEADPFRLSRWPGSWPMCWFCRR